MICESCHKKIANVHFIKIVNNERIEMHLCEQCAKEKKQVSLGSQLSLNDFFSGIMGGTAVRQDVGEFNGTRICDKCGMTFGEFEKTGKIGCGRCYEVFHDKLDAIIKRLHGNNRNSGKVPEKISKCIRDSEEIENLKHLLQEAIKSEEYEKAAKIRDDIKKIKVDEEVKGG